MLLDINDLPKDKILSLIKEAISIKNTNKKIINKKSIANIFMEPSTRTKISFQKAQKDLQMDIYNLDFENSSLEKNESLLDTIYTLKQYGINNFIIRSNEEEYWNNLNEIKDIQIINAGDGKNNHPTQALIDAMTIYEQFNTLDNLKILICGDIKNSRVFNSFKKLIQKFNSHLLVSSPKQLQDKNLIYVDFNGTLPNVDVVMMLRIQFERHLEKFEYERYNEKFGINKTNIINLKKNAILLHPGPINRGMEIASDIGYENPQIKILTQVKNGLYIRKLLLGKL